SWTVPAHVPGCCGRVRSRWMRFEPSWTRSMTERATSVDTEPTTYNVLFVCTGNTCRSPMAEAIARRRFAEREWTHVDVASAGVAAGPGSPASSHAIILAADRGLDLTAHRSQPLSPELVEWADLILAMSASHLRGVAAM